MTKPFPRDFVWGTATSAFQIEGAAQEGGRGTSIWDRFCRTPGKVLNGDTGDVACDHVHRMDEDVELLRKLGVSAYRFSVAWPRIFPTGLEERPLEAGLDLYDRLVDKLLAAGITPWVTLYHWDLPQPLEDAGGWPARGTVEHFVRYVDAVSRRLGDRVKHWNTINEPWVVAWLGYHHGVHAPGRQDPAACLAACHHLLLAHGLATQRLRANVPGATIGIVLNSSEVEPASPSAADADAARRSDGRLTRWFADPLYGRGYPEDVVRDFREEGVLPEGPLPWLRAGDLEIIATPTDYLGINYYMRAVARSERVAEDENLPRAIPEPGPEQVTDFGWEIHPETLTRLLVRLERDYAPGALYVTENGAAYHTGPGEDGRVRDERRVAYLRSHVEACAEAVAQGAPLRGYFAWSLMDNFEWAEGYHQRFGLVWVDFETLERTPKDSYRWYQGWIREQRT